MTGRLENKRILVTGASRGIGRAVAAELARSGATLALVARNEPELQTAAGKLEGGPHVPLAFDVCDAEKWEESRRHIAPDGELDGVVTAAAALGPIGPLGTWGLTAFRATLDVNVLGTLLPILSFAEELRAARASVVTFSGGGATGPLPRFDAYATSKAAVVRLTENLAVDLEPDGIRLNSVAPGFVLTSMHEATLLAGPDLAGTSYFARTQSAVAEGTGDPPEQAAELVSFLVSDEAGGITGKLLSARWDPWRDEAFQERLRRERDLATLRRIDDQFFTSTTNTDDVR